MSLSVRNYWINLFKLIRRDRLLRPLVVAYYVTTRCNLNCAYCEDFGARRNPQSLDPLALEDALRALRIIRGATDRLILTGGEPLLHPDIIPLVTRARRQLKFRHVTLLTNGLLLPQSEEILTHLDRLVVSLDTTDPQLWSQILNAPLHTAQAILDNVRHYAAQETTTRAFLHPRPRFARGAGVRAEQMTRRAGRAFQFIVNCVLTPETLPGAQNVLEFCIENHILVSFSPQAVRNWPHYDLLIAREYKAFLSRLIKLKRQGAPILGSDAYLRTMHTLVPYSCYPTLVPRILPNGDLVYPCRPIEKETGNHGGRPCNLLEVESWDHALAIASREYGSPPRMCTSCFQQCFAEPSLMQNQPFSLLWELLRFTPSRRGSLWTHAPG